MTPELRLEAYSPLPSTQAPKKAQTFASFTSSNAKPDLNLWQCGTKFFT
jgi:hypothetical protein